MLASWTSIITGIASLGLVIIPWGSSVMLGHPKTWENPICRYKRWICQNTSSSTCSNEYLLSVLAVNIQSEQRLVTISPYPWSKRMAWHRNLLHPSWSPVPPLYPVLSGRRPPQRTPKVAATFSRFSLIGGWSIYEQLQFAVCTIRLPNPFFFCEYS